MTYRLAHIVIALVLVTLSARSQPGAIDATFNPGTGANAYIRSVALQPDGKIIIGGLFTSYNGTGRNYIARLNADGSLDNGFNPGSGANDAVMSLGLQPDGKIMICGDFTSYNGTGRNRIARLNADGSLDTGFNPGSGSLSQIASLALQSDGKILIGGSFSTYNGTGRNRIARVNADGSLDSSFDPGTGSNSTIVSISAQPDGKIVIGGYFTSYNGTARNYIARLNANGSLDAGFNPGSGANGSVLSLTLQLDGKIVVGGFFTSYDGTGRNRIARLNADGSLDTSFDPGTGASSVVAAVGLQTDGKILIGGNFTTYNGTGRNRIARLYANGSLDIGFNPGSGLNSDILSFTLQLDARIIIGGFFTTYNGIGRNYVARVLAADCPLLGAFIGDPCDDGDACTENDVVDPDCDCVGTTLPDSDEDGICDDEDDCPLAVDGITNFDENTCACALGYFATITDISGNDVITACTICPPGSYCPDGIDQFACAAGYFSASSGQVVCDACTAGKFSSATGSVACQDCAAGYYNPNTAATECFACLAGTFSSATGSISCMPCAAGYASNITAATSCAPCPPGSFSGAEGSQNCSLCPANTYNALEAQTECLACPNGPFTGVGATGCTPTNVTLMGNGSVACGTNTTLMDPGGTGITFGGGQTLLNASNTAVININGTLDFGWAFDVYFAIRDGSTGQFLAYWYPVSFGPIPINYTGAPGQSLIVELNMDPSIPIPGFSLAVTYTGDCVSTCSLGYYLNGGVCTICPPGSSCPDGVQAILCPAGYFSDSEGQVECTACAAGKFSSADGSTACQDCAAGYYNPTTAATECLACEAGSFSGVTGSISCMPCAAGYASNSTAATSCAPCPPGSFSVAEGSQNCSLCPANTYNALEAQTECIACPSGESSGLGAIACTPDLVCTTTLNLIFNPDGVTNIGWELRQQGSNLLVQSGGGVYPPTPEYSIETCLPDGDFYLVVNSNQVGGGIVQNGIQGGYRLETTAGVRLVDNRNNFLSGTTSQIAGGEGFSLPVGTDRLIYTSCDKLDWRTGEYIVANNNPAVAAYHGGAFAAQTGYEMWFYNPNGGYSFRRFHSHAVSDGFAPNNPQRACHIKVNGWGGVNTIPAQSDLLNVKVRGRIMQAGLPFNLPWGPACRFRMDEDRAECPLTHLMDVPGSVQLSCGATRAIGSGGANLVHARPVNRYLNGVSTPANKYQFRFRIPDEFIDITKTSATGQYWVNTLGIPACKTYRVEVRASFDNGATYCNTYAAANPYSPLWGRTCDFTTSSCAVGGGNQNMATAGSAGSPGQLSLYPNPNNGEQLILSIDKVKEGVEKVSVDIFDSFGKRVNANTIAVNEGFVNTTLDLNGSLAAGMYNVTITAGDDTYTERLVVQP